MNSGFQGLYFLVPVTGVEPVRYRYHGILSFATHPEPAAFRRKLTEAGTLQKVFVFKGFSFLIASNPQHIKVFEFR